MPAAFIKSLPNKTKVWYALAATGLMISDGNLGESERYYLEGILMFLGEPAAVAEIVESIKQKKIPDLPNLRTDRKTAVHIFLELASLTISDERLMKQEVRYLVQVGKKLGFEQDFIHKVLRWGKDLLAVEKQRKWLMEEGGQLTPTYQDSGFMDIES